MADTAKINCLELILTIQQSFDRTKYGYIAIYARTEVAAGFSERMIANIYR